MAIETTSLSRNLSRFELAISILLIALLFGAFMSRMSGVEGAAERSILQARYQDMQARLLTLKVSFVSGREGAEGLTLRDVVRHIGRGEIVMLASRDDPGWEAVEPGGWAWWEASGTLVYRVMNAEFFELEEHDAPVVRFKLEPRFVDTRSDGRYDPGEDRLTGAVLRAIDADALRAGAGS